MALTKDATSMATFLQVVGDKPISLLWQQETYVVFHVLRRLARGKKVFVESAPSLNLERKKPMKKNLAIVVAAVALSGCATFGQLEDGLNALVGRHEKEAFSALGYPNSKQEFSGDTVYYWGESRNSAVFMPQTATTTGYVGRTPVFGTTTSSQLVPVSYNCTIKLVVGEDKVIKDWEFSGNLAGCEPYIKRVKSYTKGGQS